MGTRRNDRDFNSSDSFHGEGPGSEATACGCGHRVRRREFLKAAGLGLAVGSLPPASSGNPGPSETGQARPDHLVPADKQLDAAWVKSLFERGVKDTYRGDALDTIGMPCGGIGAGQLYLCGDGTLGCWQIFNNAQSNWVEGTHATYAHRGIAKPVRQWFLVSLRDGAGHVHMKMLNREDFKDVEFQGEYPVGTVRYVEAGFPVRVELEAFSPFIPLNAADSGLPATLFHVTVENTSAAPVRASLWGYLENAVCLKSGVDFEGSRKIRILQEKDRGILVHSAEKLLEAGRPPNRPNILFADFEGPDYGNWQVEGEAFGRGPARGTLEGQQPVTGFEGQGLVNSFFGGDQAQGTLTSPLFTVSRRFVNFLVGGGAHEGKTCVNLVVDGKVVRSATGRNEERLRWRSWNVRQFEGKEAHIVIMDKAQGGWGHINVDHIEFADEPRQEMIMDLALAPDFGTLALGCLSPATGEEGFPTSLEASVEGTVVQVGQQSFKLTEKCGGLLRAGEVELAPDGRHTFTFVLAWHFPNQEHGHEYANRFADAPAVVRYVFDNHDRLTAETRLWRDTYYDSTLPYWLLDRLHSTVSTLATGTCQRWRNGRFWAYEGVACCHGTCTHVWNYAQAHARLFPELARSVRELQDFCPVEDGGGYHKESGLVGFRSDDKYAADGQCGTILKAYREYLLSLDDVFLRRYWPRIEKALEFLIAQDGNEDGLIENTQHNTYDINYEGPNTFVGALYLAALRAGEEMAKEVGDNAFAQRAHALFESGRRLTLERLWDGEYFIQDVDLEKHPKHQYGPGCLSDQLFGQSWAHQVNLGYLYPTEHVQSALQAIWKYNWAPDVGPYNEVYPPFRWFIDPGQAGLITCTWPKSDYLPEGTMYKDEVWTGIEYQVAAHMIWEGLLTEGIVMCRAVHDRYYPKLRNPYNEVECGDHYARALSSWGVLLALAGFEYHGPKGHIGFTPRISSENFRVAFTSAQGWGTFSQSRQNSAQRNRLIVRWGRLAINSLALALPPGQVVNDTLAELDGRRIEAGYTVREGRLLARFEREVRMAAGHTLEVTIQFAS